jgi:hypothetical protein
MRACDCRHGERLSLLRFCVYLLTALSDTAEIQCPINVYEYVNIYEDYYLMQVPVQSLK